MILREKDKMYNKMEFSNDEENFPFTSKFVIFEICFRDSAVIPN